MSDTPVKLSKVGLVIARHGATKYNVSDAGDEQRIRGWIDLPLTDGGREEAEELCQILRGYPIEEIISSDLIRAEETAQTVAECVSLPVIVTPKLRPWNLGLLSGRKVKDVEDDMAKFVDHPESKVPSGESFNDFLRRLLPFVAKMAHKAFTDKKIILLVTHTRCLQAVKAYLAAGAQPDIVLDRSVMDDYSQESGTGGFIEVLPHMILGPEFKVESINDDPDSGEM